jgi:hypothetical protein
MVHCHGDGVDSLAVWQNADPGYQPALKAREQLAALRPSQ